MIKYDSVFFILSDTCSGWKQYGKALHAFTIHKIVDRFTELGSEWETMNNLFSIFINSVFNRNSINDLNVIADPFFLNFFC